MKTPGVPDSSTGTDAELEQEAATLPDAGAGGPSLESVLAGFSEETLMRVLTTLASDEFDGRKPGTAGGDKAREFLKKELEGCGIVPLDPAGYEQSISDSPGANLLGLIEGTEDSDRYVLISAHFDHLGSSGGSIYNGAYDNAAAVANVMAVACAIQSMPLRKSVLVALWDQEEPPAFLTPRMGSQFFVNNPPVALDKIDVAVVLDLAGSYLWPSHAVQFALGSEKSPEVEAALEAAKVPDGLNLHVVGIHLPEVQPMGHQPWSDYHAFRNEEIPFLFLTNGQNKVYHTPQDDMSAILPEKLELEAKHLLAVTYHLAQSPKTPVFDATRERYGNDLDQVIQLLEIALGEADLVGSLGLATTARTKLQSDLEALLSIRKEAGEELSSSDVATIRKATQRVMCLCGGSYSPNICLMM
jgi:hypothetical protein